MGRPFFHSAAAPSRTDGRKKWFRATLIRRLAQVAA